MTLSLRCADTQCVAGCCRVLQGVAGCCRMWQGVAACCSEVGEFVSDNTLVTKRQVSIVLQCVAGCCSALQCVAVCCRVLQGVAVCCSVLQCSAAVTYIQQSPKYTQNCFGWRLGASSRTTIRRLVCGMQALLRVILIELFYVYSGSFKCT